MRWRTCSGHRHRAVWQVTGVERALPLLPAATVVDEGIPLLRAPREGQDIVADYGSLGLTLRRHPLALLRDKLQRRGVVPTQELWERPNGKMGSPAGLVITRQRPGSAGGVTFVTMEDETGYVNLIVWNRVADEQREALLESRLLEVHGSYSVKAMCSTSSRSASRIYPRCSATLWWHRGTSIEPDRFPMQPAYTSSPMERINSMPLLLVTMPGRNLKSNLSWPLHQLVLEVNIFDGAGFESGDLRQGKIVRADQADRAAVDQCANQSLRAHAPIGRIRALQ